MSTSILDLQDSVVTDTGSMVAKHEMLIKLALAGQPFAHLPFVPHPDIDLYHHKKGTKEQALRWIQNDVLTGPPVESFNWRIPKYCAKLKIDVLCNEALVARGLDQDERYLDRLAAELQLVEERDMTRFLQCLIWVTTTLRKANVVWGLGRGSSCASLVLYLLDVNKVDPVKYDIPMEEFYK